MGWGWGVTVLLLHVQGPAVGLARLVFSTYLFSVLLHLSLVAFCPSGDSLGGSSGPSSCSCWLQWGGDSSGCWVCRAGAGVMAWPYTRSPWGLWTLVQTYMHVSHIAHRYDVSLTAQVNHKFFSVENRKKYIKNTLGRFLVIVILLHSCHKKRDSITHTS